MRQFSACRLSQRMCLDTERRIEGMCRGVRDWWHRSDTLCPRFFIVNIHKVRNSHDKLESKICEVEVFEI